MPTFHFNLRSLTRTERDEAGIEFESLEKAFLEAHRAVAPIAAEMVARGETPAHCAFEITDARGQILMDLPFSEVLNGGRQPTSAALTAAHRKAKAQMENSRRLREKIQQARLALQSEMETARCTMKITRALLDRSSGGS